MKIYFALLLVSSTASFIAVLASDSDCNNDICDNDILTLTSLAKQLNCNGSNVLNMSSAFFPPLQAGAKFLTVTYFFDDDDDDNCNVSYIWAEGGFLLVQPPWIFQFTSLFFNHVVNAHYDPRLYLTLPGTCKEQLVQVNDTGMSTGNCSCKETKRDDLLLMLTHQVC